MRQRIQLSRATVRVIRQNLAIAMLTVVGLVAGVLIGEGKPDIVWNELIEFKRTFTEPVPAEKEEDFAKNGIDAYHGPVRFCGPCSIEVDGEVLEGRCILIAAGAAAGARRDLTLAHTDCAYVAVSLLHLNPEGGDEERHTIREQ